MSWALHLSKSGKLWDCLNGNLTKIVERVPAKGIKFTWCYGSKYGQCETFAQAREWVEALEEAYGPDIPADKRWLCKLSEL